MKDKKSPVLVLLDQAPSTPYVLAMTVPSRWPHAHELNLIFVLFFTAAG